LPDLVHISVYGQALEAGGGDETEMGVAGKELCHGGLIFGVAEVKKAVVGGLGGNVGGVLI